MASIEGKPREIKKAQFRRTKEKRKQYETWPAVSSLIEEINFGNLPAEME